MVFNSVVHKIKGKFLQILKALFRLLGVGITSYSNLQRLQISSKDGTDLEFLKTIGAHHAEVLLPLFIKSKSQLRQDLFVLSEVGYKNMGYFVEYGATNGIELSNTYLLEKEFLWKGILVEPAKIWQSQLKNNRPNAFIETLCVWKNSQSILQFNEVSIPELSTINEFSSSDLHVKSRQAGKKYEVGTISLIDLLKKYNAPRYIDYLSIDTEGSEYEILRDFDFHEYSFGVITVEHNFSSSRGKIYNLLIDNGYKRKFDNVSNFDDWYTK